MTYACLGLALGPGPAAALFAALLALWAFILFFGRHWLMARAAGAAIPLGRIVSLVLKRADIRKVVVAVMMSEHHGLNVPLELLERHAAAGGDPSQLCNALLFAAQLGLTANGEEVSSYLLSGGDARLAMQLMRDARVAGGTLAWAQACEAEAAKRKELAEAASPAGDKAIFS